MLFLHTFPVTKVPLIVLTDAQLMILLKFCEAVFSAYITA